MISLYDLLEASNGQLFGEPAAQLFSGFCLDANEAKQAEVFVAIKGDYGDTHKDMRIAVDRGVTGILCQQPPDFDTDGISVIVAKNTATALFDWAAYVLQRSSARPIVVTGTMGRATTISAIAQVLRKAHTVHAPLLPHMNGRYQLPLALAQLDPSHEFVVLELVADEPGSLASLIKIVNPDITVFTHIGQAFLDRFDSIEQIAEDYTEAFKQLNDQSLVVLNYNNDWTRALTTDAQPKIQTIGVEDFGPDWLAYNIVVGPTRTGFDLRYQNNRYVGNWAPILGKHQVYSLLSALAIATYCNVPIRQALRALTELNPLPGRMNTFIGQNNAIIVDDSYDATPESTQAVLAWLQAIKQQTPNSRAFFVFGDMGRLGNATRQAHRSVGYEAADVADVFITEGEFAAISGRAAQDVITLDQQVHITYSLSDTVSAIAEDNVLTQDDIILITGGTNSRMEMVVKALLTDINDYHKLPRHSPDQSTVIEPQRPMRPSWVELDQEQLAQNVRMIKAQVGDDVTLMATVKANAYGHGAVSVSRVAVRNGAAYLAVASIAEALELRDAGITTPILLMSYTPVYAIREALRYNLTVTVYDLDLARAYERVAKENGQKLKVHVKVDTGMGRLGVLADDATNLFRYLIHMHHLDIEGLYTHFPIADEDREDTFDQLKLFKYTVASLRAGGISFKYTHASNSAATLLGDAYHFNMVRTGLLMYGCNPSGIVPMPNGIAPLLTWKTIVAQVKTLPPGHSVGYGKTYRTTDHEQIAILPVGYSDGLRRSPTNWGEVLIHGQRAPIIGRVSMEKLAVSVQHLPSVSIGDEVVLLGKQGNGVITAEEIAERLGTISYEVLTNILPRVPRH